MYNLFVNRFIERDNMTKKIYSQKQASQFNKFRSFWQIIVCKGLYMLRLKLIYRIEVHGRENIPNDNKYIICPNHLSTLDPPMIAAIMPRSVAFMAKKELFEIPLLRWLDWLGAFAVNRERLDPSTIKTVEEIKNSNWVLGLFPQGTRGKPGEIKGVTKGFAGLARLTKCNILPVGIIGTQDAKWLPFSGKIIINIGKIIPYDKDLEKVRDSWIEQIQDLSGFTFIPEDENKDTVDKAEGVA